MTLKKKAFLIYDPFDNIACKLWIKNQDGTLNGEVLECFVAPNCQINDVDFSNSVICSACLTGAQFLRCKFVGTIFEGCSMQGCLFISCDLTGAIFMSNSLGGKSNLIGAVFENSNLNKTDFRDSEVSEGGT